jgi:hypothetical protein
MQSLPNVLAINTDDLIRLVDRARNGTPPGEGWGLYEDVTCDHCGMLWNAVAMLGTKGKECPYCGHLDPNYHWLTDFTLPGDGVFLNPVGWEYAQISHN